VRKLFSLLASILLLSGCSTELSFSKVGKEFVKNDVKTFIDEVKNENGAHLFFDSKKAIYVYLNGKNVKKGEKAVYFTDFDVEERGNTLYILYSQAETSADSEAVKLELLYKVNLNKNYDSIRPVSNGQEVSFDVISGNQ
jgi:uncharacterized protein YceK